MGLQLKMRVGIGSNVVAQQTAIATQPTGGTYDGITAVTLSVAATGTGLTYQWQSSAVGAGSWSNVVGATNSSYAAGPLASRDYRCIVTGSNGVATSSTVTVTVPTGGALTANLTGFTDCGTSVAAVIDSGSLLLGAGANGSGVWYTAFRVPATWSTITMEFDGWLDDLANCDLFPCIGRELDDGVPSGHSYGDFTPDVSEALLCDITGNAVEKIYKTTGGTASEPYTGTNLITHAADEFKATRVVWTKGAADTINVKVYYDGSGTPAVDQNITHALLYGQPVYTGLHAWGNAQNVRYKNYVLTVT